MIKRHTPVSGSKPSSFFRRGNEGATALVALLFIILLSQSSHAEEADNSYKITSPLSGVINKVYVKSGQQVKKGDLLLDYDMTLINSNFAEAQANIKLEKFNRSEAKKEFERAEELYDRTVLSEYELQQARLLYTKAQAQYVAAENRLIHAQWDKQHSKLYSTISGKVGQVFSYPGQYVNNQFMAQPLLSIKSK